MDYTKEQLQEAKDFIEFYIDLVENNSNSSKYYLASNVVLDWFGKTIKGDNQVGMFLRNTVSKVGHEFQNSRPASKVGFRETHNVTVSMKSDQAFYEELCVKPLNSEDFRTPPNTEVASTSSHLEMGQGDGVHNCTLLMSPAKKQKIESDNESSPDTKIEKEESTEINKLKYVTSEGCVEFRKPSMKKFQAETKWKRPCKLHIGYTSNFSKDCTIYLVIYEGNLKCRRNLLKEFDSELKKT